MKTTLGIIVLAWMVGLAAPAAAQAPAAADSPYAGAAACKDCHTAIYDAWDKTKHAHALSRLGGSDRQSGKCIECHVTGTAEQIAREGAAPSLRDVQCEACHGPGRAHAAGAAATPPAIVRLVKKPGTEICEQCHNARSPRFKGFMFGAMVGFVHKVKS